MSRVDFDVVSELKPLIFLWSDCFWTIVRGLGSGDLGYFGQPAQNFQEVPPVPADVLVGVLQGHIWS
jgi:hypothetical protein